MPGDERYFLERDKGPVRRFLRDYVDSRRTVAEFFLPMILVVLLLSFVPFPADFGCSRRWRGWPRCCW